MAGLRLNTARTVALSSVASAAIGLVVASVSAPDDAPTRAEAVRVAVDGLDALRRTNDRLRREIADARSVLAERNAIQLAEDDDGGGDTRELVLLGGTWTVTASSTPEWSLAAERLVGPEATTWQAGDVVWAATRASSHGTRRLARVALPPPPSVPDVSAAASGLTLLDEPRRIDPSPLMAGLAAAILAALGLAALHHRRFAAPLATGRTPASEDARAIARAIEGGARARAEALGAREAQLEPELGVISAAIRAMGEGDLAPRALGVSSPLLGGLAASVEEARAALAGRVSRLHSAALEVARGAERTLAGARSAEAAEKLSSALAETLSRVEAAMIQVDERGRAASAEVPALEAARQAVERADAELSKGLAELQRSAVALAERADRLDLRAVESRAADEALERLATVAAVIDPLPAPGGRTEPAASVCAGIDKGRQALAELRAEVEGLSSALVELGGALSSRAAAVSGALPTPTAGADERLRALARAHAEAARGLAAAMADASAALAELASDARAAHEGRERVRAATGGLASAFAALDLGPEHDGRWAPPSSAAPGGASLEALKARVEDAERRVGRLASALVARA